MISGRFGEIGELIFEIELIATDEGKFAVDVLLDTGFTTGLLVLDTQDAESLGWSLIERNRMMQMARGQDLFDIYQGKVLLNQQEYIIPVIASLGIGEPLLGLQWLKMLPLAVNFEAGILTLG
jgi:predicted aspartyl protease